MNLAALSTQHQRQSGFLARRQFGNWIDGRAAEPRSGRYLPVVDPATEMTIAEVAASDARDVDAAVAAARRAFDSGDWPRMRPASREKLLHQLAERLERYADELAALETLETGKLIGVARAIDVLGGAEYFAYTRREAVGVVGAIVPWNFPLAIALWKVATALACGCTVVLKPSEETPLTALRLGELAQEAGLPDGVLNIVTGAGAEAGAALAAHPGIDKITFTGSVGVGRAIGHAAVERMARFTLELGGKSPLIVLDDAAPDFAAHGAAQGIFFNQGQVCTAGSRVYVQKRLFERVVAGIAAAAEAMKIGSGFDPNTQIGPLVSKRHFERVLGHVDAAKEEGATLVTGGTRALDGGYFVKPTVFVDAAPAMRIVREEVFGPVVTVTPFDTVDDAVRLANGTDFGLAASVWSQNLSHVHRVVPRLKAGIVWVNTHNMLDPNLPFGGFKQSGYGRELGRAALEQFTELKSVCIAH